MKTSIISLLLLLWCLISGTGSSVLHTLTKRYYHCDETEIFRCLTPVAEFENPLEPNLAAFDDADDLEMMCGALNMVQSCIGNKLFQCYRTRASLAVNTIENILGYMCGNGKNVFLTNAQCWEKPEFLEGMKMCEAVAQSTISSSPFVSRKCRALVDLNDCLSKMTKELCGDEAGHFINEMIYQGLIPSKQFMRCGLGFRLPGK